MSNAETLSPHIVDDFAIEQHSVQAVLEHWRSIETACEQACQAIAPAWPLDRAIAVNPHWSRIGMPIRQVAARMAVLGQIQVFPSRQLQLNAWRQGRITDADLRDAIASLPAAAQAHWTPQACVDSLSSEPVLPQLPLLIDLLDDDPQRYTRLSWRQAITHQVSQTCAAFFDQHQADWQPERDQGLYAFWRDTLQHDHGIGILMGLPQLGKVLDALPATRQDAERWVMQKLGLPQPVWSDYLESVLLTVNGWASWCAYLNWQARLEGKRDEHLRDLLAIRLAWGVILLECKNTASTAAAFSALQQAWSNAPQQIQQAQELLLVDEIWQLALEAGYQRQLARTLLQQRVPHEQSQTLLAQAAFCIDVRSEPIRRAIENTSNAMQTMGFAGFFGLPIAYTPLGTEARRPQLPGLLAPSIEVSDVVTSGDSASTAGDVLRSNVLQARSDNFAITNQWRSASLWPSAAFSFVEAAGVGYLGKLGQWLKPSKKARSSDELSGLPARYQAICRPQIIGLDLDAKVGLAQRVLHAMGFAGQFAPLVLLVGHGSQSANNAHAAALDCGACCGQTGEVNARSLAQLLNAAEVRAGLQALGVAIPIDTHFIAALHNTTTDEIEAFDLDLLPTIAQQRWAQLQPILRQASDQVRQERAPRLGLSANASAQTLLEQLQQRANDGAQTRPEWGLAGNAAFLIAPRQRSRKLLLDGRSFLHDYDAAHDTDFAILELLMTAPMLVTHWINWQYHASTCEPTRFGSGNKVLHNVVGGQIGVFEGNGGDLRIGLSRQSLHDGQRWVHEPLRLTVVIDAPAAAIDAIIAKHPVLQQLLNNGWIHLWRFEDQHLQRYQANQWQVLEFAAV